MADMFIDEFYPDLIENRTYFITNLTHRYLFEFKCKRPAQRDYTGRLVNLNRLSQSGITLGSYSLFGCVLEILPEQFTIEYFIENKPFEHKPKFTHG